MRLRALRQEQVASEEGLAHVFGAVTRYHNQHISPRKGAATRMLAHLAEVGVAELL